MTGKIAIEEHFASKEATSYLPPLGVTAAVQKGLKIGRLNALRLVNL